MTEKSDRLERIFYLIPYIHEHQGVRLSELAEMLGTTEKEVLNDLNSLFMSGGNEWQQVDVRIEKGKVFVERADFFARPLSLTIPEALSLMLAGSYFKEAGKVKGIAMLEKALNKINNAVPEDTRKKVKSMIRKVTISPVKRGRPGLIKAIEEAVKEKRELQIEYYTYSRDDFSKRAIRPYGLINYAENWYLAGFCLLRDEDRIFRVDRIKNAVKTKGKFTLPDNFNIDRFISEEMYRDPAEGMIVKIKLAPEIVKWFKESLDKHEFEKGKDGSIIVTFFTSTYNWLIKWILPYAEHVQVLEPKFLADELEKSAREVLEIYKTYRK